MSWELGAIWKKDKLLSYATSKWIKFMTEIGKQVNDSFYK